MPVTYDSVQCNGTSPGAFVSGPTGNPTMGDYVRINRLFNFQAANAATTDLSIALPYGARILAITYSPAVAATGATSGLSFGTTSGGADLVANTSILGTAKIVFGQVLNTYLPLTVANFASIVVTQQGGSIIWMRNTQGTPTAVGTGLVNIDYVMA